MTNINILKSFLFFAVTCCLFACGSNTPNTEISVKNVVDKTKDIIVTSDIPRVSETTIIEGAIITKDSLIISLSYSGGCEDHYFDLYTNGVIAKSLPPQLFVNLIHTGKKDVCRELIRETATFNLSSLKKLEHNKLVIRIKNYDKPLLYQPITK